jgi:branched-chain amino acid transport system permease protein
MGMVFDLFEPIINNFKLGIDYALEQLINGINIGGIYALIAVGYTMVYGIIELINFAHGEIYMLGAYLAFTFYVMFHLPFPIAVLLSILSCLLLGIFLEFIAYRPLRNAPRLAALITAIGASLFLQNLALIIWGGIPKSFPELTLPDYFQSPIITIYGSASITLLQYNIFFITVFLMFGLHILITRTKIGTAMRACAQDKTTASLMGINVNRVITFTFAVGSSLGAVAGILAGLYYNIIKHTIGYVAGVKAFAAAVLGGIGNVPGAMLGGFVLGIAETFGAGYISSPYRDGIAYAVMILVIIFRPSGILGRKQTVKV